MQFLATIEYTVTGKNVNNSNVTSLFRMSCAKSNSYNVEEYEAEREQSLDKRGCEDDEPMETPNTPDNSEKGTSFPSPCTRCERHTTETFLLMV